MSHEQWDIVKINKLSMYDPKDFIKKEYDAIRIGDDIFLIEKDGEWQKYEYVHHPAPHWIRVK